jgi:hypothetical protein
LGAAKAAADRARRLTGHLYAGLRPSKWAVDFGPGTGREAV